MTQTELTDTMAVAMNITKRQSEKWLDTFKSIVAEVVEKGDKVQLTGFGTFDLGKRSARHGINPRTGESLLIPEMVMPRFRAGTHLKEIVRHQVKL